MQENVCLDFKGSFFPLQAQQSPVSRGKPPKSARPDSNASPQPKTHGPTPAPTPDAEKRGPSTAGCPKPEEEAAATTHPTGHKPDHHNGGSPRKAGQWPEQLYTGPVQKRARAVHMRARRPKRGGHAPYTKALYRNGHANMHCTHEGDFLTLSRVYKTLFDAI